MFTFYGLQEVKTVTLPDKKEGARIANIYCRVVGFTRGTSYFAKIEFNYVHALFCEFS